MNDRTVSLTSALYAFAVDAWGAGCGEAAFARLLFALVVDVFEVEGVDVAWDVAVEMGRLDVFLRLREREMGEGRRTRVV